MRTALLSLSLLVAACSDDNNRLASLESTTSDLAAIRAELAALRAQVGAMPTMPDVKPLADRLAAVEASVAKLSEARKVPHLVARDTGADYGISVDGALAAWDSRFEAVIDYSPPQSFYFDGPDCTGVPYFDHNFNVVAKFNRYLFLSDGRLVRPASMKWVNEAKASSVLDIEGKCSVAPGVSGFAGVVAAFSTPRISPEMLDIQLR